MFDGLSILLIIAHSDFWVIILRYQGNNFMLWKDSVVGVYPYDAE
jgi:hypothetical protein